MKYSNFISPDKILLKTQKMPHRKPIKTGPHFKVEWRQLTYYSKSTMLSKLKRFGQHDIHKFNSDYDNIPSVEEFACDESKAKSNSSPKRILNSLDGCFRSGELSAILGPSGAGKSTFLSALFGSKQDSAYGQTKVTWIEDKPDWSGAKIGNAGKRLKIASLPQHDHLSNHLTVYETLLFASKIKNASKTIDENNKSKLTETFHKLNVKRVAKMLKLTDCLDTRCGKLSGGQYKRVSIGQELLSEPDIIILDEPTSGLDSMTCLSTIKTLKSIVNGQPISIVLTIHQPDIEVFNLFDHIYVIAQGGTAIYEGPPTGILSTLAAVNLRAPTANYNPARFIVEHAFYSDLSQAQSKSAYITNGPPIEAGSNCSDSSDTLSDSDDDEQLNKDFGATDKTLNTKDFIKRSLLSLTDAISGKEIPSGIKPTPEHRRRQQKACKDRKPLLNLGIKTLEGQLITSEQLNKNNCDSLDPEETDKIELVARLNLIRRLSDIQKSKYYGSSDDSYRESTKVYKKSDIRVIVDYSKSDHSSDGYSSDSPKVTDDELRSSKLAGHRDSHDSLANNNNNNNHPRLKIAKCLSLADMQNANEESNGTTSTSVAFSPCSSSSYSLQVPKLGAFVDTNTEPSDTTASKYKGLPVQTSDRETSLTESTLDNRSSSSHDFISLDFDANKDNKPNESRSSQTDSTKLSQPKDLKWRREFDKSLSSKNSSSKSGDQPTWTHAMLLGHRTWLSIIRDPIFFGIQFGMHTIIPIILALIFGSVQEEGCPQVRGFDIVEFAYSDSNHMLLGTMESIRRSIGNVGIMFFEMFVVCFAINCITALVFPSDMFVLLKEYRNGWYSMSSYFIGRTIADLPVPVMLHSLAIIMLYTFTGQPFIIWRLGLITLLVVMASLVAQSVGLTVGAILMQSSQSAVLAAAGIVAPFFALSGFIVRIHTLPWLAKLGAKLSYLYHLLNGFIILRYGFDRCPCDEQDFEVESQHTIPKNLHTMASIWIGTYSNDYANSNNKLDNSHSHNMTLHTNSTSGDPNIDVIEKLMSALNVAKSFGHKINSCKDVLPYSMLDFDLRENDIYMCFIAIGLMIIVSRCLTFVAIYYKIRSFS